jgi:hypothetical protein
VFVVSSGLHDFDNWFTAGRACMHVFLIPFLLVGVALIGAVGYQFLALFNPSAILTVPSMAFHLGSRLRLSWELHGATGRLRDLAISLEGREEATYRRGTSTHTDRETFAVLELFRTEQPDAMLMGASEFLVPADTAPSFEATYNKIKWSLRVRASVPFWPYVDDQFEVVLVPSATLGGERR